MAELKSGVSPLSATRSSVSSVLSSISLELGGIQFPLRSLEEEIKRKSINVKTKIHVLNSYMELLNELEKQLPPESETFDEERRKRENIQKEIKMIKTQVEELLTQVRKIGAPPARPNAIIDPPVRKRGIDARAADVTSGVEARAARERVNPIGGFFSWLFKPKKVIDIDTSRTLTALDDSKQSTFTASDTSKSSTGFLAFLRSLFSFSFWARKNNDTPRVSGADTGVTSSPVAASGLASSGVSPQREAVTSSPVAASVLADSGASSPRGAVQSVVRPSAPVDMWKRDPALEKVKGIKRGLESIMGNILDLEDKKMRRMEDDPSSFTSNRASVKSIMNIQKRALERYRTLLGEEGKQKGLSDEVKEEIKMVGKYLLELSNRMSKVEEQFKRIEQENNDIYQEATRRYFVAKGDRRYSSNVGGEGSFTDAPMYVDPAHHPDIDRIYKKDYAGIKAALVELRKKGRMEAEPEDVMSKPPSSHL